MVVMWDVDGVLANFHKAYWQLWNRIFGMQIDENFQPETWDARPEGTTDRQESLIWATINQSPTFWYGMEPLVSRDVLERINEWEMAGRHLNYFVTSRTGFTARHQTYHWLRDHLSYDLYDYNPSVVISKRKGEIALGLGADYAIDDKAGNAVYTGYHSSKTKSYLLDYPKNQFSHDVIGTKVRRVYTVAEFMNQVERGE